jgi:type I restriction enzyme S subunit
MKTRTVRLADVCEINPSTEFDFAPDAVCSFVPMESVDDVDARIAKTLARPFNEVAKGYTQFAVHDVIVAKITPCMENGKCAIARNLRNGVGFGSTEFHVLRALKHIIPEWLFYFWRLPETRQKAARNMTGTAGQKRVPAGFLESLEVPLRPLSEQRRIVRQLEQADRLRRTRRYALELSDTFLPAAFLQGFGDPASNPVGFPMETVGTIFSKQRAGAKCGPFGSALKNHEYVSQGIPVWTMENVGRNEFREEGCLYITPAKFKDLEAYDARNGDILISRAGTVGRMAIVETKHPRSIIHTNIIRLSLDVTRCLPIYFTVLMTFFAGRVGRLKSGQDDAYTFMNTGRLAELRIPLPPRPMQQKFATIVARHEHLRAVQRESLRQAEHLFQSLLHQAFNWES